MLPSRKDDHIRINLEQDVASALTNGLEQYHFQHQALPELDFDQVDPSQSVFGKRLELPLLISSMTGGTAEAEGINRTLALAAQETGIAMGVGSQRAAIQHPETVKTFQVRKYAPDILLFGNLGAVQLNYGYTVDHCKQAVEMIEADGLYLHLNPLQEVVQPEGDVRFAGLLRKIEAVCTGLEVPVIAKEVGSGISGETARRLYDAGVAAIDVAGAGGTSWSQVEMYRNKDVHARNVAAAFQSWGIPTAEAIRQVREQNPGGMIIASGGLKDGVDIAKSIALGASIGGMAGLFLRAAVESVEKVTATIHEIGKEIKVCMFLVSAENLQQLQGTRRLMNIGN